MATDRMLHWRSQSTNAIKSRVNVPKGRTESISRSAGTATNTASAPMSGPYALSAFGDAIFEGEVNNSATVNVALLVPAYQNVYGDIYSTPGDIFESKYASSVPTLLPSTTPMSASLTTSGTSPARSMPGTRGEMRATLPLREPTRPSL